MQGFRVDPPIQVKSNFGTAVVSILSKERISHLSLLSAEAVDGCYRHCLARPGRC